MSSPASKQITQAEKDTERLATAAYGIADPAIKGELSEIQRALQGGESPGMKAAFGGARTSLMESGATAERDAIKGEGAKYRGAAIGGNMAAGAHTPEGMGTSIARALYGSRITEAGAAIGQRDKLFADAIGKGSDAGSGSLSAFGNELANIPYMQKSNSTYGNILGALNAAGTAYGAAKQSGWFNPQPATDGGSGGVMNF